jgi:hypothetical protein
VFSELGHVAVGLEGAEHFAVMARTYSGCEVWQKDFLKLDLPDNHFDGVYANASLFHLDCRDLLRVRGWPTRRRSLASLDAEVLRERFIWPKKRFT